MIFNRIKWFSTLIKTRGILKAFGKLRRELYQRKKWVILKLPKNSDPIETITADNAHTFKMHLKDYCIFEQIAAFWPTEFPAYNKKALLKEFEFRLKEGTIGYYLRENDQAIGAMWLSSHESNLIKTPFELKENDKVVKNIFISPSQHGRSLAKKLVYEGIQDIRARNIENIYALVYPDRIASIKTFLALGFHEVGSLSSSTFIFTTKITFQTKKN